MENQISFIQIEKDNSAHYEAAKKLWVPFIREMNLHECTHQTDEQIIDGLKKRIAIQGQRKDMHFELAFWNEIPFGIAMFAIDLGTVYGLLEKGYGTIMGFYIHPDYRCKGLGTVFSKHIEVVLCSDGAAKMYICPDAVTGEPFWKANGYEDSGKIDPDEQKPIYIKQVRPDFANGCLIPLSQDAVIEISQWEYEAPYEAYSIKGNHDEYLMDESTWGTEQFCLTHGGILFGQVSCQYEGDNLWVGWSMAPQFCGQGNGAVFVTRCVQEIRRVKDYTGRILLRVSARNKRAIKAYQKAGFRYMETIQDEIAHSDNIEDFWVMVLSSPITIREAIAEADAATFWEQLHIYHKRDIFPNPDDEDLKYFLGSEYHDHMLKIHSRPQDRCYFLFFHRDGQDIGFTMPVIFTSEDGKCFIMEYCVYPEFRGSGTGKQCARVLLDWAKENGARYAELNHGRDDRRRHFWESVGFIENGADQWGEPLMLLPPKDEVPITVEVLSDPEDWQLKKLENGFLTEIGEQTLTEERQEQLRQAIRDGRITFLVARRGYRAVGMCSVAKCFSTFSCTDSGVFDDFYIEPVFRGKGLARRLVQTAQAWCEENGIGSLTVCCAPCDEPMYQALGFKERLGTTFTAMTE